jgi:hypothetical protein
MEGAWFLLGMAAGAVLTVLSLAAAIISREVMHARDRLDEVRLDGRARVMR